MCRFRVNRRPIRRVFHRLQKLPASCEFSHRPRSHENGTERNGTERNGTERNGTERNGTERNDTIRYDTIRYGTVPENKGIFAGVHTRTSRNVPLRSEK